MAQCWGKQQMWNQFAINQNHDPGNEQRITRAHNKSERQKVWKCGQSTKSESNGEAINCRLDCFAFTEWNCELWIPVYLWNECMRLRWNLSQLTEKHRKCLCTPCLRVYDLGRIFTFQGSNSGQGGKVRVQKSGSGKEESNKTHKSIKIRILHLYSWCFLNFLVSGLNSLNFWS
jgi:hypothetical protein